MQLGVSGEPPLCRCPALVKVQGMGLGGLHSLVEDADLGLFGIEAGEEDHGGGVNFHIQRSSFSATASDKAALSSALLVGARLLASTPWLPSENRSSIRLSPR